MMNEEKPLPLEAELYLEEYAKHRDAGDDPMNARLRIIEQGCPVELAASIQDSFAEMDDD